MTKFEKDKLKQAISTYTEQVTKSPARAKAALTQSGIYKADGKLSPEYMEPSAA